MEETSLDMFESERASLKGEIARLETERERLARGLDAARQRGTDLASLYVATHRLHSTLDRGQVVKAIEEIVASLLGCESFAVLELSSTPSALTPVVRVGVPMARVLLLRRDAGVVGRSLASGEIWLAPSDSPSPEEPVAAVPLRVDGQVTGVLVLFELLEHKGRLESADRELLEVLSTHAGTALMATRGRGRGEAL